LKTDDETGERANGRFAISTNGMVYCLEFERDCPLSGSQEYLDRLTAVDLRNLRDLLDRILG
jgi:hypothetical protein